VVSWFVVVCNLPALTSSVEQSTKERLVLTGERLFAIHGVDGVSLRQIGAESGMANNSVVQYHFGSKEGLIDAILVNRLNNLAERRKLLFARVRSETLRSVAEAQLLPVVELAEQRDCYYLMFLEQLVRLGAMSQVVKRLTADHHASQRSYVTRVSRLLGHIPPQLRAARINQASALCLHTCAERQRALHFELAVAPFALHASQLLDGVEASLSALPSADTLHALKSSSGPFPFLAALP
jgi:AcrR family transcriptional regulator